MTCDVTVSEWTNEEEIVIPISPPIHGNIHTPKRRGDSPMKRQIIVVWKLHLLLKFLPDSREARMTMPINRFALRWRNPSPHRHHFMHLQTPSIFHSKPLLKIYRTDDSKHVDTPV